LINPLEGERHTWHVTVGGHIGHRMFGLLLAAICYTYLVGEEGSRRASPCPRPPVSVPLCKEPLC